MQTQSKPVMKNEYDLILDFAQAVVPHNWNVYWSWEAKQELKKDHHTCNIQLQASPYRDTRGDYRGMVHYLRWLDGIMFTQIYLDMDDYDLEETILHELAHVAEQLIYNVKGRRLQAQGGLTLRYAL